MLRSLESDGLVTVGPSAVDRRVRFAKLTRAGRKERAMLDRRSDELAASLVDHLDDRQQARLVAAMADVERLLTAAMVRVEPVDPALPEAQHCLVEYFTELDQRFRTGFDPAQSIPAQLRDMRPPRGVFLLASLRGEPIGCGALKLHERQPAEIKRMWVDGAARGLGLGRRLLAELETYAAGQGAPAVRLETNRVLTEAIALYRSSGYSEVAAFNEEPYADHWFEKPLR
jgi:ribosomal protein S18 acetylase RimI-like enzyme